MEAQSLHNVNEASTLLIRSPGEPGDLTSILQHITQTAQDTFATDACVILAFNPITGRFIGSQTAIGSSKEEIEALHDRPRSDGVTQQVLKEGVILVEDLEAEPQYHNQFTRNKGIRAFAGLALLTRHRKRPLGVIYLDFKQLRKFSAFDSESFQNFAIQASFLLQETWLAHNYEEVARIGQDVNQKLSTVADLFQELQTYVDAVLDDSHSFVLAIYQPQTDTLDLHIREQGNTFFVNSSPQGEYQYIIKKQQSWFVQQLSNEAKQLPFQIVNITGTVQKESLIFVPLTLRSVSLGVLSIQHPMPNAYGQEDLFILQLLATHIALALHNMRLYDNLTRLNETGQLLTQQLDSEQVLQTTVNKIRDVTKADVVVLYPYESALQRFVLPPRMAGTLLDPTFPQPSSPRPDDIAVLSLHHGESIFAEESENIYSILYRGDNNRQGSFLQREKIRSTAAVPLKVGEKLVGVLFVNFRQPQYFNAPQKLLIEGLAHYAGIAIKNAEAFDTLIQRRMRELVILQDIDRELSYTLDLKSVLDTLLKRAYEHVSAEEASILLHNSGTQILETVAAIGRHAEISLMQNIPPQESKSITRWVLKNKKPARVDNVHHDLKWRDLHLQVADDTISELDVPLLDGEDVVGVINFESIREGAFRQEDQDFLVTLAGQAVLAIKRAQAYEREKHLLEEAQALNEISKEITSQLDLSHVFDLILEKALELNNTKTGELMLYDSDQGDLWMAAERGVIKEKKGQRLTLDQGVVGYVARTKQWQIVDPSQSPWSELYLDFIPGTRSELAVPLLSGSDLRGVLNVESPTPHNFYERDVRLLTGLADLAVIALQNAQAYEREKHLLEEAQALNEISKEITSQLDLSHVFDLILEKALELTNSTLSTLMLHDPDQNDLWMVAERVMVDPFVKT